MLRYSLSHRFPRSLASGKAASPRTYLTCAIIGSGPAGFYTASRLLSKHPDCHIHIYESLPVPYGLARFGVAPDHPEVKQVTHKFDEVASSERVKFFGNVQAGKDVSFKCMSASYNSIVFAYGASGNRTLGIPNENLPGVLPARSFVGWYNGLPAESDLDVHLEDVSHAVVIGHGNVALDIARILLSSVDELRKTDISQAALEVLSTSKIDRVTIAGRRGPLEASFTIKEIRELVNLKNVGFVNSQRHLHAEALTRPLSRPQKRLMDLLSKSGPDSVGTLPKSWDLRYLQSPYRFLGTSKVEGVRWQLNELEYIGDRATAVGTAKFQEEAAQLALVSVGYKAEALEGMSDIGIVFNTTRGCIPNEEGRVVSIDGTLPGLYCAGWAKNGPTGIIATTMRDSFETADNILLDWQQGRYIDTQDSISDLVGKLQRDRAVVDWQGWKRIQQWEADRGRVTGRSAVKETDIETLLRIAGQSS